MMDLYFEIVTHLLWDVDVFTLHAGMIQRSIAAHRIVLSDWRVGFLQGSHSQLH
jgi:hypothetical protein